MGEWIRVRKKPVRKNIPTKKIIGSISSWCKQKRDNGEINLKHYECLMWAWDEIRSMGVDVKKVMYDDKAIDSIIEELDKKITKKREII